MWCNPRTGLLVSSGDDGLLHLWQPASWGGRSAPAPLRNASVPQAPPSTSVTGICCTVCSGSDGVIHHLQGALREALGTAEILEGRGLEHDVSADVLRLKEIEQAVLV